MTLVLAIMAITTFINSNTCAAKTLDLHIEKIVNNTISEDFRNPKSKNSFTENAVTQAFIPITIVYHGEAKAYSVPRDTVENTLKYLKIFLQKNDVLQTYKYDYIFPNQIINIPKIEIRETQSNEVIPFCTQIIPSDKMRKGESKIIQSGHSGTKKVKYSKKYFNDNLLETRIIYEETLTPAQNTIIEVGTQNIINTLKSDSTYNSAVLIKTQFDNQSFSLPKVTLSDKDRDLLERLLTGEFGSSYTGACLVAQAIKCAIVYDGYTSMEDLIIGMGYVGDTNQKTQNAVNAAKFIFDENGLAVKHRLFYMCTEDYYNSEPGNFHSTQNFILQYENVKFFDRW